MGQTIAEKILSSHSGKKVFAGEIVVAEVDFCVSQDGTTAVTIDELENLGAKMIFDRHRYAMVIDHSAPSPLAGISGIHKKMRDYAKRVNCLLYDIGEGISHQLLPERGHVVPGDLVIGADSHTTTYGALNVAATGVGSSDLAAALLLGKLWFKVPPSLKMVLEGTLPAGVFSKDVILYLIGDVGADGATYLSVEYGGPIIETLSQEARFTISNMAVEMGAKFGLMLADVKTINWLKKHSSRQFRPVEPDKDAQYVEIKEYDLSKLSPQVAKPHQVDNVAGIEEVEGIPIQQGVIGTCTNGRLEDFQIAARILAGQRVHPDCRLIVVPASKKVFLEAMSQGIVQILMSAGGVFVTPGCGPCVGTHNGIPASGENVISSANRNFFGRMGNNDNVSIYLASPATVAASVIEGKITDPRKYLVNNK